MVHDGNEQESGAREKGEKEKKNNGKERRRNEEEKGSKMCRGEELKA